MNCFYNRLMEELNGVKSTSVHPLKFNPRSSQTFIINHELGRLRSQLKKSLRFLTRFQSVVILLIIKVMHADCIPDFFNYWLHVYLGVIHDLGVLNELLLGVINLIVTVEGLTYYCLLETDWLSRTHI